MTNRFIGGSLIVVALFLFTVTTANRFDRRLVESFGEETVSVPAPIYYREGYFFRYKVLESTTPIGVDRLDELATDGWRLVECVPHPDGYYWYFENSRELSEPIDLQKR